MTEQEKKEFEALRAENKALKQREVEQAKHGLSLKVSNKGAVSLVGLRRPWPVTFYAGEWARLEAFMPQVTAFIASHADEINAAAERWNKLTPEQQAAFEETAKQEALAKRIQPIIRRNGGLATAPQS